jgi:hypothetical protein
MPICLRLLTHCILDHGQEQGDEHANDRDDHQQLDEREAGGARTRGAEGSGIVHDLSLRSPITKSRRVTHARARSTRPGLLDREPSSGVEEVIAARPSLAERCPRRSW